LHHTSIRQQRSIGDCSRFDCWGVLHEREHVKEPAHEFVWLKTGIITMLCRARLAEVDRLEQTIQAEHSRWTLRDYAIIQLMLYAGLLVHEIPNCG
jgi:hypothetical protein